MFKVPIDKIVPVTSARAKISGLVSDVQDKNSLYVLTRGGKPAAILTSIEYFEKNHEEQKQKNKNEIKEQKQTPKKQIENKKDIVNEQEFNNENVHADTVSSEQPVKISIN